MHCTPHASRELLDKHLLVLAAAETKGHLELAALANKIWTLHEIVIDALNEYLSQVTE
jgi:hypothetical protein